MVGITPTSAHARNSLYLFLFDAQAGNYNSHTQSDGIRRCNTGILLFHEGSILKIKRDYRELVSCHPLHCERKQKEALSVNQEVGSHQP